MIHQKFDLTIVIPAYKEAKRIGSTLDKLSVFLKKDPTIKKLNIEVLVVSADSLDDTHEIVRKKTNKFTNMRLLKPGKRVGKGRDVKYGMDRAKGNCIVFMDADLATPLKYLPIFYDIHNSGIDIVIATRNLLKHHSNFSRRFVSNIGNFLFRLAGGVWVEDSQCGFKMFSKKASKECFNKLKILGWGFDMEILAIAKANKLSIKSVRVDDWESVPEGTFTEGLLNNSINSLKELGIILWRRISGQYF